MGSAYEGWTNFETECVNKRLTDLKNRRYWRAMARWHASEAKARHPGRETCREARQDARLHLSSEISLSLFKNHSLPFIDIYGDLLAAALNNVDYAAIAERLLDGFFEDGDGSWGVGPEPCRVGEAGRPGRFCPCRESRQARGQQEDQDMPRYRVTITEVITNWKRIEMEAESPEALVEHVEELGDYDPDELDPQTVDVTAADIVPVDDA